jgi:DNA-binding IclR family transcriptional regulator
VQLAVLSDALDVIYLAKRDGTLPVRLASTPGRSCPATCTATGKAMLADLPTEELAARLAVAGDCRS